MLSKEKERCVSIHNHNLKTNDVIQLKSKNGITLVALVVTIIVLLILAGVTLSSVLSQDGIFSRAEQATDKYGQSKARETLELTLGEAQMQKHEEGLTDKQLDNKIASIEGELLPKEKPENPNLQNVIVDGYIFEIDRSVPKIVDYIGPADGVVITATITQNGDWQNPVATVKGTIKTYSGGNIINSTATVVSGNANVASLPTTGGNYTIENITEDTDIKITAKDNKDKSNEKVIKVRLVRENTPPVLSNAKAEADRMKIKISVTAIDTESGVAQINYTVEPNTVKLTATGEAGSTGRISSGQVVELTASEEKEYTVTFTATDNAGNTSAPITAKATTIDGMTVAEVKEKVNASNIADYIGTKVIDYETGAIWRVFYVDPGTTEYPNGYFGDGAGTIYLKRDYDSTKKVDPYHSYRSTTPSTTAANYMKQLNPLWRDASNGSSIDLDNERMSASFYEQSIYGSYKNSTYSTYAVGAPPIEMWCKAHSIYKNKYEPSNSTIGCGIQNANGYGYTINGGSLVDYQSTTVVNTSIEQSKVIATDSYQWLASPAFNVYNSECYVNSSRVSNYVSDTLAFCPVVPLNR